MNSQDYTFCKALIVRYHSQTEKPSRISVTDKEARRGKPKRISWSYDSYLSHNTSDQAMFVLNAIGAEIVAYAEMPDHYIIAVKRPFDLQEIDVRTLIR